jgi:hypothetical protein
MSPDQKFPPLPSLPTANADVDAETGFVASLAKNNPFLYSLFTVPVTVAATENVSVFATVPAVIDTATVFRTS